MQPHTKAIGEIVAFSASLGWNYDGWIDDEGTRLVNIYPPSGQTTIACWSEQDYFTAMSSRKVSNIEGVEANQSVPYVDAEQVLRQAVTRNSSPDIQVEPDVTTVGNDAVKYLDGIRAKGLLFVHEDDFSMRTFRENILAIEDVALNTFMDIVDEFDLDLDPSDDAAADDTTDHDITRSFQ